MTTRVKTYIAAGAAAFTLAAGTQMLLAATSADKATVDQQDQQPRGRGPGFGGPPPGGPGMRGPGGPMGPMVNAMLGPALLPAAEDLANKIAAHLEQAKA